MALRFRRTVRLGPGIRVNVSKSGLSATVGPRGFTTTIGKNGMYRNVGIPGTGLSYRYKVGGASSSQGSPSPRLTASERAVRAWEAKTGESNLSVRIEIDEVGNLSFYRGNGERITDRYLIDQIKRTPEFKSQLPNLKAQQQASVAAKVMEKERENAAFVKIYVSSPSVLKRPYYEAQLARLVPNHYEPQLYAIPAPTPTDIQIQLSEEADRNVTGVPWKLRKLKEQYFNERFQDRLNAAVLRWQTEKAAYENSEAIKAAQLNAEFQEEYKQLKLSFEKALEGDKDYIEAAAEQWIASVELPVDIATQYEYRATDHCLMVDLDLPEIEDLPTQTAVQLASGNMSIKKKTQKDLRAEYAECVFGLAIFVAANLFNASPEIQLMVISGYTQRRNKAGDIVDDYIYSIKFLRERFYFLDYKLIDPESFCLGFENRCNVTPTKVFKAIEPYA